MKFLQSRLSGSIVVVVDFNDIVVVIVIAVVVVNDVAVVVVAVVDVVVDSFDVVVGSLVDDRLYLWGIRDPFSLIGKK